MARPEQEIFEDLQSLCTSSGYVHTIAYFCFRDNFVGYSGEINTEDFEGLYSKDRLIRTEMATLIGLMLKKDIDYSLPHPEKMQDYVTSTEALLLELHDMMSDRFVQVAAAVGGDLTTSPFSDGEALREPIFYGGESAYSFQYRDLSLPKYNRDNSWLVENKGFTIQQAQSVLTAICRKRDEGAPAFLESLKATHVDQWTMLPMHTFTVETVAQSTQLDPDLVWRVIAAFSVPTTSSNDQFRSLHDFNIANACPLIPMPDGRYLFFSTYSVLEALYESPFYWMGADGKYASTAMRHRGQFTENFASERLVKVFGAKNVFSNVEILDTSGRVLGEIDVLVVFGDRAIVLQAKSKRLTMEARRGNDSVLRDDFRKAIQNSSDQAHSCAGLLFNNGVTLRSAAGEILDLPNEYSRVYLVCLLADHYPALSFQARHFLTYSSPANVSPPFVMDVFALDAITEMLESPLQFLSYIDRRTGYAEKVLASHELTILSYHLSKNLWLSDEYNMVMLHDDFSLDLDVAMTVRREGIAGKPTPNGILTELPKTAMGRILSAIEKSQNPALLDLGFAILTFSGETIARMSDGIEEVCRRCMSDGRGHDFTIVIGDGATGVTVHCNDDPSIVAGRALEDHCIRRKYISRATTWFGLCLRPADQALRFGINLKFPWVEDTDLEQLTNDWPIQQEEILPIVLPNKSKVGRNAPCPCGSGKKAKRCNHS